MQLSLNNWSGSLRDEVDDLPSPLNAFRSGRNHNYFEPSSPKRPDPFRKSLSRSLSTSFSTAEPQTPTRDRSWSFSGPTTPTSGLQRSRSASILDVGTPKSALRRKSSFGFGQGLEVEIPRKSFSPEDGSTSPSFSPKSTNGSAWSMSSRRPSVMSEHQAAIMKLKGTDQSESDAATIRKEFRQKLLHHYRSIVHAWRLMDPQGNGRALFPDVCRVAKECNFVCNVQALWKALDQDGVGFARLEDIDAPGARLLQRFAQAATDRCGSAEAAWSAHFTSGQEYLRCRKGPFLAAARKVGFDGNTEAVFSALNADCTPDGVVYEDFALLDKWFVAQRTRRDSQRKPGIWDGMLLPS